MQFNEKRDKQVAQNVMMRHPILNFLEDIDISRIDRPENGSSLSLF